MASPISFSGLGSGLDTRAIIDALLQVERFPILQLEDRRDGLQEKLSLMGTLKGHVSTLKDKAKGLSTLGEFLAYKVETSDDTAATFDASGTASAGSHTLEVVRLASADRWAFDAVSDNTTDLSAADGETISFDYDGQTYNVTLTAAASSLDDIVAAINTVTNGEVEASVVQTGVGATPAFELVLAGKETGDSFRISNISSTVTGLTIDSTGPDVNGNPVSQNNIQVANNAHAIIDGQDVYRLDNDFSDVLEGVSIQVESTTTGAVSFSVGADKDGIKANVKGFVDAYNELIKFVNKQNSYDEDNGPGGPLFGDNILRTMVTTVREALFNQSSAQVAGDTAGFGTLRLLGVESNNDGTLKINDAKLEEKLTEDVDAFAELFVDSDGFDNGGAPAGTPGYYIDTTADTGLMDDLVREIDRIVQSYNDGSGNYSKGLFDARTDAINSQIKLFNSQIDAREFRLEIYERQLTTRFAALESTMAQLNAQQAYLGATLG